MLTIEEELRLTKLQLETIRADRDAEKRMKATARDQRNRMTKQYSELVGLLKTTGILAHDGSWAEEIQKLVEGHKKR